ncbi:hypothetical protein [Streptomyces goshikiensis]|uniref:hypothetical protein n=1 Tax=Streptomyces goshikiensis TaxID=1942 RepID=UPI0036662E31
MNQYGRRALRHWQEFRPGSIPVIDEPELGEAELGTEFQGEVRVRRTTARLTPAPGLAESHHQRSGCQQQRYEARVLRELALLPPENNLDQADDPELWGWALTEVRWPQDFTASECAGLQDADWFRLQELTDPPGRIYVRRRGEYV